MSNKTLSPLLGGVGSESGLDFFRVGGVCRGRDEAHAIAARLQQLSGTFNELVFFGRVATSSLWHSILDLA